MRNRFIVCYDIAEPKRLQRMFKMMRGFGDPLQYSVFYCDLSEQEKVMLVSKITEIIHHREDRIMIINIGPLGGRAEECVEFIGTSVTFESPAAVIV